MKYTIYDFYDAVLKRPGMFVGDERLTSVYAYLSSANLALTYKRYYENNEKEIPVHEAVEFENWLSTKLSTDSFLASCEYLIKEYKNEESALTEFTRLYKEYRGSSFGKR